MKEHQSNTIVDTRLKRTAATDLHVEESPLGSRTGSWTGPTGESSGGSAVGVEARALHGRTAFGATPAQLSLLKLQRLYGNRYVQRMLALSRQTDGKAESEVTQDVESAIDRARGSGRSLDSRTRNQMESVFGVDFGGVRIHTGAESHTLNRSVNAVAFTTGRDIFFRDGAYNPGESGGRELLAHELTHVVQQGGAPQISGRAQRVAVQRMCSECEEEKKNHVQAKLVVGEADDQYEQEADSVARTVVSVLETADTPHERKAEKVGSPIAPRSLSESLSKARSSLPSVMNQQLARKPDTSNAERDLGARLWQWFPQGVNVAFYQESLPEAEREANDWAKRERAVGLKVDTAKITARNVTFGRPLSDSHQLVPTITALSEVLHSAAEKGEPPEGTRDGGPGQIRNLALFGHGWEEHTSAGHLSSKLMLGFIKAINEAKAASPNLNVIFFTCSGARNWDENYDENKAEDSEKAMMNPGGGHSLAAATRDAMKKVGLMAGTVWGHSLLGRVSENPALRVFSAEAVGPGVSYAADIVFTQSDKDKAAKQLQETMIAEGYELKDPIKLNTAIKVEVTHQMYRCYINANRNLKFNGAYLSESAPTHPQEVAKVIRDHWTGFWNPRLSAELIAKHLKLGKASHNK